MAESSSPTQAGVLLAAGRSRRMGKLKQLLPVPRPSGEGDVPMVVRAFDLLDGVCGGRVVVVSGDDKGSVTATLAGRAFTHATSDSDADMLVSVQAGLAKVLEAFPGVDGVWLHLADHPFVRPATIDVLSAEFDLRAGRVAVLPTYHGRGGHPALLPQGVLPDIINWRGEGGLRSFWIQHPTRAARVEVNDPGVVHDLDTPQQYNDATGRRC